METVKKNAWQAATLSIRVIYALVLLQLIYYSVAVFSATTYQPQFFLLTANAFLITIGWLYLQKTLTKKLYKLALYWLCYAVILATLFVSFRQHINGGLWVYLGVSPLAMWFFTHKKYMAPASVFFNVVLVAACFFYTPLEHLASVFNQPITSFLHMIIVAAGATVVIAMLLLNRTNRPHNATNVIINTAMVNDDNTTAATLDDEAAAEAYIPAEDGNPHEPAAEKLMELYNTIETLFEDSKPYLDAEFSIGSLSRMVNSNINYVSKALNHCGHINFRQMVNKRRIAYFKQLVKQYEPGDVPIQQLFAEAGFVNQATFNRIFKELEGITPSSFIQKEKNVTV